MTVHAPPTAAVAIGGSAGGVAALQCMLRALPPGFAPAVLVVLHVAPDRPSGLAALFAADCVLTVVEVVDKQPIAPGCVYIAPPNYHMLVDDDRTIALSIDPPVRWSRPAIDPLFESAADVYRDALLGILLTGASDDGADGAAAIRRRGGRVWIQDPATAVAATMPDAALARAGADLVLDVTTLSTRLAALDCR